MHDRYETDCIQIYIPYLSGTNLEEPVDPIPMRQNKLKYLDDRV
jgi:hypothetical protein